MAANGNFDFSAYPVHSDVRDNQQVSGASSLAANIGSAQNYDALLRAISNSMHHGNSSVPTAISDLTNEKARQPEPAPVNLAQRGSTAFRRSEMVDFEGRVATRNDVVKVNPVYPLGVIRDLSKSIKSGRDLPSTTNARAYPKSMYKNAIMGSANEVQTDKPIKRWNPKGWYLYVNPFENRNEAANTYLGNVALSFSCFYLLQ